LAKVKLSGLHAGKLEHHGLADLKKYIDRFFRKKSDYTHIDILYLMFRHKIAHIAYPYLVFKTADKKLLPHRRVVWTVGIYAGKKPIELIDYPSVRSLLKTKTPWPVPYNSRIKISQSLRRRAMVSTRFNSAAVPVTFSARS
jgi:hypothetical protein